MYIQPGQDSISWEQFLHVVGALKFIMELDVTDATQLAYDYVMNAHMGIHCSLADHAQHAETMTEETVEALRQSGVL